MEPDEPHQHAWQPPTSLLYLLKRAHLAARALADDALAGDGMSVAEYAVLRRLEEAPGLSGAELARRCFVTAPTINGLLIGLEQGALIERLPDPQGGRCILARLTRRGQQAVTEAHLTVDRLEQLLFADVDSTVRDQLRDALATIAGTADAERLRITVGAV
jgi:DNA-binding MarR family transcriptional regulator